MCSLFLMFAVLIWLITVNVKNIVESGELDIVLDVDFKPALGRFTTYKTVVYGPILLGILSFIALIHILLICGIKYVSRALCLSKLSSPIKCLIVAEKTSLDPAVRVLSARLLCIRRLHVLLARGHCVGTLGSDSSERRLGHPLSLLHLMHVFTLRDYQIRRKAHQVLQILRSSLMVGGQRRKAISNIKPSSSHLQMTSVSGATFTSLTQRN
jgi:hypothetical protein